MPKEHVEQANRSFKSREKKKKQKPKPWQLFNRMLWENIFIVFFSILLCVAIGGVLLRPRSHLLLALLFVSGGGINVFNGMKLYRNQKQRNMGMSMMLLGAIILLIGFYVLLGQTGEETDVVRR